MKKMLIALLCAVMLLCSAAFAENTDDLQARLEAYGATLTAQSAAKDAEIAEIDAYIAYVESVLASVQAQKDAMVAEQDALNAKLALVAQLLGGELTDEAIAQALAILPPPSLTPSSSPAPPRCGSAAIAAPPLWRTAVSAPPAAQRYTPPAAKKNKHSR